MDSRAAAGSKVDLPSQGILYGEAFRSGQVIVAPMSTREEKMLASGQSQGLVDMLIERCVFTDTGAPLPMGANDFLVGDRLFLMMAVRAVSFGQDYTFQMKCDCGQEFQHTTKIPDDLATVFLDDDFREPFEVELPYTAKTKGIDRPVKLTLRLLRGSDEKAITKFAEGQYEKVDVMSEGDPAYTYRMLRHIVSMEIPKQATEENPAPEPERLYNPDFYRPAEGEEEMRPVQKRKIIARMTEAYENLLARDTQLVRDALSDNDCGVNTEIQYACPKCKQSSKTLLPMKIEFFRPGGNRGIRYL